MHKRTLVALLLLATCTACQKKAEGQTVAVVNDEEITTSELNAELANANIPTMRDKKAITNRILQGLIDRRLLAEQARKDGIDRSPDFIARQRRVNEELLIGMLASRSLDTSKLPTDAEIAAFQAKQPQAFANREIWKLEQLQYDTPRDKAITDRIVATKSLDQLIAVLTAARIPFQRANNQLVTSAIPAELYPQLARLRRASRSSCRPATSRWQARSRRASRLRWRPGSADRGGECHAPPEQHHRASAAPEGPAGVGQDRV
jgi:peptidyl-prolyl cis-trans isomerase C